MRWVKLTLPALPVRLSWLLRMRRLTSSRRAGITRKLVAVGTSRLAVMLATMRPAAPRRAVAWSAAAAGSAGAARSVWRAGAGLPAVTALAVGVVVAGGGETG